MVQSSLELDLRWRRPLDDEEATRRLLPPERDLDRLLDGLGIANAAVAMNCSNFFLDFPSMAFEVVAGEWVRPFLCSTESAAGAAASPFPEEE